MLMEAMVVIPAIAPRSVKTRGVRAAIRQSQVSVCVCALQCAKCIKACSVRFATALRVSCWSVYPYLIALLWQ